MPTLDVNWGTWDVMRVASAEERAAVAGAGLSTMDVDRAFATLAALMTHGTRAQYAVASVDWQTLAAAYGARRDRPMLSEVAQAVEPERRSRGATADRRLLDAVGAAEGHQRREVLSDFLRAAVAVALDIANPDDVDVDQGLFEMGMDSLMSVELKGQIEEAVGLSLPSTLTFNYPSVAALATYLADDVLASPDDTSAPSSDRAAIDVGAVRTLHDDLDEDELEALLASRLAALDRPGDGR